MTALLAAPALANHPGDRDCSDFDTQAEAQAFFDRHGGSASNNVDRLDADGDGEACETLPGGGGNGGGNGNGNGGGNGNSGGNGTGELPESATGPVPTGAPLPLLLTVLGIGTFGLALRRRIGVRP